MNCGDWSEYWGDYRWYPLPGGNHRAVGDALAALALMQRMAAYATRMLETEQEAETEDDLAELLPEEERGLMARFDTPMKKGITRSQLEPKKSPADTTESRISRVICSIDGKRALRRLAR